MGFVQMTTSSEHPRIGCPIRSINFRIGYKLMNIKKSACVKDETFLKLHAITEKDFYMANNLTSL
jgi:hypothetical protein